MKKSLSFLILATMLLFAVSVIAADKVVIIPLNSSASAGATDRVWGQGRSGTGLLPHTPASGYCTSAMGINFALSKNLSAWGSASSVCPAETWVCRKNDLPIMGSCSVNSASTFRAVSCDGTKAALPSIQTELYGYAADASSTFFGRLKYSGNFALDVTQDMCVSMHVWCWCAMRVRRFCS